MVQITQTIIKKIIMDQFSDKKFTCGDIIYAVTQKYTRNIHGIVRNILTKLTQELFLEYRIEVRGVPHFDSDFKRKGAVFFLKK